MEQLNIPTADLTTAPSLSQLQFAVHFIQKFQVRVRNQGPRSIVNCVYFLCVHVRLQSQLYPYEKANCNEVYSFSLK